MTYTPNRQHRDRSFAAKKSQWSISLPEENTCYVNASGLNWSFKNCFWGLHFSPQTVQPLVLGVAPPPASCNLHMAKFVGDAHGNWHGYPVAHWMSPYDRPGENVLKDWCDKGFISKSGFSKIRRGKRCAL